MNDWKQEKPVFKVLSNTFLFKAKHSFVNRTGIILSYSDCIFFEIGLTHGPFVPMFLPSIAKLNKVRVGNVDKRRWQIISGG